MSFFLVALILTSLDSVVQSHARYGYAELFNQPNRGGDSMAITENADLTEYPNLDDKVASFCVHRAIVILYTEHDYNEESDEGDSLWAFSSDYNCFNVDYNFSSRISSVWFASNTDDYRKSHLYFFKREGFRGNTMITHEQEGVDYRGNCSSIIVTGLDPWTIYDGPGYTGNKSCIYPKGNYVPGFYPYKSNLGGFADRILSATKRCNAPEAPENLDTTVVTDTGIKYLTGSYRNDEVED